MTDDQLDPRIRDAAAGYNQPPTTPREEMWAAIQAGRIRKPEPRRFQPLIWGGLAAAAVLFIGIMIGRGWQGEPGSGSEIATGPGTGTLPGSTARAFQIAASQYFGQTEEFLTGFRSDLRQGGVDESSADRARQLLSANRLLMDSPAGEDPRIKALLEDLELVLAEISQLNATVNSGDEAGFIEEGLEEGGLLGRLRTAVPAGQQPIGL